MQSSYGNHPCPRLQVLNLSAYVAGTAYEPSDYPDCQGSRRAVQCSWRCVVHVPMNRWSASVLHYDHPWVTSIVATQVLSIRYSWQLYVSHTFTYLILTHPHIYTVADLGCKCTPFGGYSNVFCVHNCEWLWGLSPNWISQSNSSYEHIHVTGSGRGIPKIFGCTSRASGWTLLSKFLNF